MRVSASSTCSCLDLELALVGQHLPRRARVVGDRGAMRSGEGSSTSTARASA